MTRGAKLPHETVTLADAFSPSAIKHIRRPQMLARDLYGVLYSQSDQGNIGNDPHLFSIHARNDVTEAASAQLRGISMPKTSEFTPMHCRHKK